MSGIATKKDLRSSFGILFMNNFIKIADLIFVHIFVLIIVQIVEILCLQQRFQILDEI